MSFVRCGLAKSPFPLAPALSLGEREGVGGFWSCDHKGNFLDSDTSHGLQDVCHCGVKRFAVAADIDGKICIGAKSVADNRREFGQRDLFLFEPGIAGLVHGNVQHVGFEIVRSIGCGGKVDGNILGLIHLEADHHEGGEEKEHDVDQRDDFDPRVLAFDWET